MEAETVQCTLYRQEDALTICGVYRVTRKYNFLAIFRQNLALDGRKFGLYQTLLCDFCIVTL